jgi:membrane protease YdiL (CAAX protease family)
LNRIIFYDLPALFLVLYLLFRDTSGSSVGFQKPQKQDGLIALVTFVILSSVSLFISWASSALFHGPDILFVEAPRGFARWTVAVFAGLSTAYFEETFFRAYLLRRFAEGGLSASKSILISALLFSLCHLYEGPWGVLNAFIAGIVLALAFWRRNSVHGPAWAHGAYNLIIYAMGS